MGRGVPIWLAATATAVAVAVARGESAISPDSTLERGLQRHAAIAASGRGRHRALPTSSPGSQLADAGQARAEAPASLDSHPFQAWLHRYALPDRALPPNAFPDRALFVRLLSPLSTPTSRPSTSRSAYCTKKRRSLSPDLLRALVWSSDFCVCCSWMRDLGQKISSKHGSAQLPRPYAHLRSGPALSFSLEDEEDGNEWDG